MATKLGLYNAAIIAIGDRPLASLTEATESRRLLDAVYDDVLADCLSAGQWKFAKRTIQADADPDIAPSFGPQKVFAKPDDWVRTIGLSADGNMTIPLTAYVDEGPYWVADVGTLYVSYVSNDAGYGGALDRWPRTFTRFVELMLAVRICERNSQNASKKEDLQADAKRALVEAKSRDAMNGPTAFPPPSSWTTARGGGYDRQRRDPGVTLT
jgi:hypothetical protein